MDPIVRRLIENHKVESLYEMANVSTSDTGLPYEIWIDSAGKNRKVGHNSPRIKVEIEGKRIPVSIGDNPEVLVDTPMKLVKISAVFNWVRKYKNVLLKHWNKEITDKEALNLLGKL